MNVADSNRILQSLLHAGCIPCDTPSAADIIIINTCTVRQHAEDRAFSFAGGLKNLKKKNKNLKIYLVGCAVSVRGELIKKRFPFIDYIIPAYEVEKFAGSLAENNRQTNKKFFDEFVTISRGCSNYCSYCIVPYARGEEVCRKYADIQREIKQRAAAGNSKITFLGQNVNSYKAPDCKADFADILNETAGLKDIEKVSFLTSHPKDLSDKIISVIAKNKKISREIHLAMQSGSDRILGLMNRQYTASYYLELVGKMRREIKGLTITTDIIVGFPSETEEDFRQTLDLVKKARFRSAFTFKYSPREGTASFLLKDDIPVDVKKERLSRLNTLLEMH